MSKPYYTTLIRMVAVYNWGGTSGIARMFIVDGDVRVNGEVEHSPDRMLLVGDIVQLDDDPPITISDEHMDCLKLG